jgi:hypothetical protein
LYLTLTEWLEPLESCFVELPVDGARDLTVANFEHADLGAEHFNAGRFTP